MVKVLVIDDSKIFRKYIKAVLEKNFEVHEAESAQEAIGIYEEFQPEIILLDVMMPDISDSQIFLNHIDNINCINKPRIALVSALSIADIKNTLLNYNIDKYFQKPIGRSSLIEWIRRDQIW